ncbi:uncharacterized protein LOC128958245 [Oppia nitens]|uniref:uncharacterized protein LOC128958245 n=1 Tax=Oppia nitens TaxID=1686743 RepID=UPI0023DCD751|nr:uncharacterized protein LOC128958245 [Oppia nitens]
MTQNIVYFIEIVVLCTVIGRIVGQLNGNGIVGTVVQFDNFTESCKKDVCCKMLITDIDVCVNKLVDRETITKYYYNNKFMCCVIGNMLDCAIDSGKLKCGTDYDRFRLNIEAETHDYNKGQCKDNPIISGQHKCEIPTK